MRIRKRIFELDGYQVKKEWFEDESTIPDIIKNNSDIIKIHKDEITISTLEGVMKANEGSWIVKGIKGEFYPVDEEIFEQLYEKID